VRSQPVATSRKWRRCNATLAFKAADPAERIGDLVRGHGDQHDVCVRCVAALASEARDLVSSLFPAACERAALLPLPIAVIFIASSETRGQSPQRRDRGCRSRRLPPLRPALFGAQWRRRGSIDLTQRGR
jgi:hypothetical protein